MKNIIIILSFLFLLSSCSKNNYWIDSYKKKAFYECLRSSYTNDTIFRLIRNDDVLFINENISFKNIDTIRKYSSEIVKNAKEPDYKYDDYVDEKNFMSNCLDFYDSIELDELAQREYREYLKAQKR